MNEFNEAVVRCPELWGRKVLTIIGVSDGLACLSAVGVNRHWVPVEKLERISKQVRPVAHFRSSQPRKRSEVC